MKCFLLVTLFLVSYVNCLVDLGTFQQVQHGVSGKVFAVDTKTLMIKDFKYDGKGPATLFWGSEGKNRSEVATNYFIVPDQNCGKAKISEALPAYTGKAIVLTLPSTKSLLDVNYFDVWCYEASASFGFVMINDQQKAQIAKAASDFDCSSRPIKTAVDLGEFKSTSHGLQGKVSIVDHKTLKITGFSYDGLGPAGLFWAVTGERAKAATEYFIVPDENCKNGEVDDRLPKYSNKDIMLTLPPSMTVFEMSHFDVWCVDARVSFGYVEVTEASKKAMNLLSEEKACDAGNQDNSSPSVAYFSLASLFLISVSLILF